MQRHQPRLATFGTAYCQQLLRPVDVPQIFEGIRRRTQVRLPVLNPERQTHSVVQCHTAPSAPGAGKPEIRESVHREPQGRESRFPAIPKHLPAESHGMPRRALQVLDGARRGAGESMSDLYDKIKEDVAFRKKWAEQCGFGFELPSVVPNVPKKAAKTKAAKDA